MLKINNQIGISMCWICPKLKIKAPISGNDISLVGTINYEHIQKINLKESFKIQCITMQISLWMFLYFDIKVVISKLAIIKSFFKTILLIWNFSWYYIKEFEKWPFLVLLIFLSFWRHMSSVAFKYWNWL